MYQRGKSWYSDFHYDGERYQRAWGAISKTVAKEMDRKFRTEVMEGKHKPQSKKILFETLAKKYLEYVHLNKKPKSATRNEVSINQLKPYFGGKLIHSIHPFMVEQYKRDRREKGKLTGKEKVRKDISTATINRDLAVLRNMLNMAVKWGLITVNPLLGVRLLKEDNEKMWILTPEEEAGLLEQCRKSPQRGKGGENRYLSDLVRFALNTGMRLTEIFNLTKIQVNGRDQYLLVTDTKNSENRRVPINNTVKEILSRRLKTESEFVFSRADGEKLTVLTNAFWYAIKEAGLIRIEKGQKARFRFHDLRHTFGSRLGMAGVDLKTIMEIMGHKTVKVAMRYQHPTTGHKLNAVRMLEGTYNPEKVPSKVTTLIRN